MIEQVSLLADLLNCLVAYLYTVLLACTYLIAILLIKKPANLASNQTSNYKTINLISDTLNLPFNLLSSTLISSTIYLATSLSIHTSTRQSVKYNCGNIYLVN